MLKGGDSVSRTSAFVIGAWRLREFCYMSDEPLAICTCFY